MDKYEYSLKLEEISGLVENGNYEDAAKIADTVDWRRVRNIRTLCMISEVFEANDRLEDSKSILTRAYKRPQMGRIALYRLTEVAIKMKDFDEAVEYYSEYVNAAPNDNSKYILKYKIYRGRGSSVEEQIGVLEEYKQHEYTEKWAFELAKLYKEAGEKEKCISECDDLVLWYRQGPYVIKALELKRTLTELNTVQQAIYDHRNEYIPTKEELVEATVPEIEKVIMEGMPISEEEAITDSIITETEREIAQAVSQHAAKVEERQTVNISGSMPMDAVPSYDTAELQNDLANSMREIVEGMTAKESDDDIIEPMNDKPFADSISQEETAESGEAAEDDIFPGQITIDDVLTYMAAGNSNDEGSKVPSSEETVPEEPAAEEPAKREAAKEEAVKEDAVKMSQTIDLSEMVERAAGVSDMRPPEESSEMAKAQTASAKETDVKSEDLYEEEQEIPKLTSEEQYIFSYFSSVAGLRESIAAALRQMQKKVAADKTSRAGNIVITGATGSGRTTLGIRFAKVLSKKKEEASARIARVYAEDFNKKDIAAAIAKIAGGTLIIEEAGDLADDVVTQMSKAMEFRTNGLVVILEDEKHLLTDLFERHPNFAEKFTAEVNIPIFTNDELVSFGKTYAYDEDYKIDDMATLALYNRIGEMQTPEHPVNVTDVKEILDKAIKRSERFGFRKLALIISHKRYDEEDRIILYEKDFK